MTCSIKALHITGMIALRRDEPDPAGNRPQFLDVATLTIAAMRASLHGARG